MPREGEEGVTKWTRVWRASIVLHCVTSLSLIVIWVGGLQQDPPAWFFAVFAGATIGGTVGAVTGALPVVKAFSIGVHYGRSLERRRGESTKAKGTRR